MKNKIGDIFGDHKLTDIFYDKGKLKFELTCQTCKFIKNIFPSNVANKEGKSCYNCKLHCIVQKRFGMLFINKLLKKSRIIDHTLYEATCDCGRTVNVKRRSLIYKTKRSCGCNNKNVLDMYLKARYNSYKHGAAKRNHEFNISLKEFKIISLNNCFYCNKPPQNKDLSKIKWIAKFRKNEKIAINGIDRVDNKKGYISKNIVACCEKCNGDKHSVTIEMARKMILFIHNQNHGNLIRIEISKGSHFKYEDDKTTGKLKLDRVLNQPCPANYGYFNSTLAKDNDATDAFVLSKFPLVNDCYIDYNVVGAYICIDNGISDDKIIVTLKDEVWSQSEIKIELDNIKKYLTTYKKNFIVKEFVDKEQSQLIIDETKKEYTKSFNL